jgi:hypothetical protein
LTAAAIHVLPLFMSDRRSAARVRKLRLLANASLEKARDLQQRACSTDNPDELCRLIDAYCKASAEVRTAIALAAKLERRVRPRRERERPAPINWPPTLSSSLH